ncbi:hypothetical protein SeLEV6574_g06641 [Synchytrium endobioticum]|uniref:Uncharacterized protein n=1 Tax=Synchytrium endobioticum TaxID=286115 RepID=A0A507CMN4_9FUNG|nr:hypothetical protein SeLEV6574_g06641 [Synchytrium endobioticum]
MVQRYIRMWGSEPATITTHSTTVTTHSTTVTAHSTTVTTHSTTVAAHSTTVTALLGMYGFFFWGIYVVFLVYRTFFLAASSESSLAPAAVHTDSGSETVEAPEVAAFSSSCIAVRP